MNFVESAQFETSKGIFQVHTPTGVLPHHRYRVGA
jgi:hypothetical protein